MLRMEFEASNIKCSCPLCGYETFNDDLFKKHVAHFHGPFKEFKKFFGQCQSVVVGNGLFKCDLCQESVKFISSAVRGHLKKFHRLSWKEYQERTAGNFS